MVLVLMSVGALLTVVGLASVAYGLPYNDFGLGNILVVAGTTAMVAGLILIALSAVLRELIAIRTALTTGSADRANSPGRPRAGEPPLGAAPEPPSAAVAAERLRAAPPRTPAPPAPATSPVQAELPPQPPLRAPPTPPPLRRADLDTEPAAYRPPVVAPPPAAAPSSDIGLPDSLRARPPAAERGDVAGDFGAPPPDWTQDPLGEPMSGPERKRFFGWTRRRQTVSSDAEAPHAETAPPAYDRVPPQPPQPPASRAPSRPAPPPAAPPVVEDTGGVAVLKSGVIDGMGYTLYTDGSIDAEFAQGVLRFGSIEDLRRHLEQHAG